MAPGQRQAISWMNGVPVSALFDDPFYSFQDGWAESAHVFLAGNDLPARLTDGFHVAELGFGTGLNLALLLSSWDGPGTMIYTAFEAYPLVGSDVRRALIRFPDAAPYIGLICALLKDGRVQTENARLELVFGDARTAMPAWTGSADAWFLDGFAPQRNPELWGAELMAEVARHTCSGGTFATYTAAGEVRRALSAAGFEVTRTAGFGRKRHMSRGVLR